MSMIIGLIDKLNKSADEWDSMYREASDTILELRGALLDASVDYRRLSAENAKLRNLLQQNYEFIVHLNETEAYPSSDDLDMQRWLLLNEVGIEVEE